SIEIVLGIERRQSDEDFKASSEETNHDPHDMQAYADGCRFGLWSWWSHGSDCLDPRGAKSAKNGKIENAGKLSRWPKRHDSVHLRQRHGGWKERMQRGMRQFMAAICP